MTSTHPCFPSLGVEIFHIIAIAVVIIVVFVVLMTGLLFRLAEARNEHPRGPTGCAYRRSRPGRLQPHVDQNVVSAAS
ncbi:hypothetical protein PAXRUDRAFT_153848 [Paxillus rubicundulus Ve08.2h10]|uniref:Uncharacterized protein n=1 Tax=Paxillus rubicundulus Ve08.2h10 TaxID=930991 RepID=A0A0D0DRK1_9AGAM|nr:hypothetical protein PAXRUDRAFT_153848 [Paxillus rubicundulus Ve08.2h10]